MNLFQTYSSQYDYPKVEKSDFFETEMWNHCKEVAEKMKTIRICRNAFFLLQL